MSSRGVIFQFGKYQWKKMILSLKTYKEINVPFKTDREAEHFRVMAHRALKSISESGRYEEIEVDIRIRFISKAIRLKKVE